VDEEEGGWGGRKGRKGGDEEEGGWGGRKGGGLTVNGRAMGDNRMLLLTRESC
jgi:hypothetical protein